MILLITKAINFIAVLLAVAWFVKTNDWEPLITSLGLIATLIGIETTQQIGLRRTSNSADEELFKALIAVLPSEYALDFLGKHDFASAFPRERLHPLDEFKSEWNDAEHEFLDPKLEKLRKKLYQKVKDLIGVMNNRIFSMDDMPIRDYYGIPNKWDIEQPVKYKEAVEILNAKAGEVSTAHQEFVRLARKKLKI